LKIGIEIEMEADEVVEKLPEVISKPYVYFSTEQTHVFERCFPKLATSILPCWIPFHAYAKAFFLNDSLISMTERHNGPFVWATEFSNVHSSFTFNEPGIEIDGVRYGGPEQYFQLMKSFGMPDHEQAKKEMEKASPPAAWSIGRNHKMRPDWDEVRNDVMRKALIAKFTQNKELHDLLLSTGNIKLVDVKPSDGYWGTGPDGKGENTLGNLLMELRQNLKAQEEKV